MIPAFYRVEPLAGLLMLPYLAWAIFALFLNSTLINLNPQVCSYWTTSNLVHRRSMQGVSWHGVLLHDSRKCQVELLGVCLLQEFTPKELKADTTTGRVAPKEE